MTNTDMQGLCFYIALFMWLGGMIVMSKINPSWSLGSVFWVIGGLYLLYYLGTKKNE